MRIVSLFLVGSLVALSFVIYEVKYDTHGMEEKVAALQQDIRKERDSIAILRAEWSHLNSPERLERLARKHLGMVPVQARQMMTLEQLGEMRRSAPGVVSDRSRPGNAAPALHHRVNAIR